MRFLNLELRTIDMYGDVSLQLCAGLRVDQNAGVNATLTCCNVCEIDGSS